MKLNIRYYPDPILKKKCSEVKDITKDIKKLVFDMIETMDADGGVGLAANQVGEFHKILILRPEIKTKEGEFALGEAEIYINPILSNPSKEKEVMVEGCLSFPGIRIEIERPKAVQVEYIDLMGKKKSEYIDGFKARVIMHENDHLNGKVFVERAKKEDKKYIESQLKRFQKKFKG